MILSNQFIFDSYFLPSKVLNGCKGNDEDIEVDMEAAFKRKMEILKVEEKTVSLIFEKYD